MKIIGITGASGAGKTTICKILENDENIKIIDTDKMAKDLTLHESQYFSDVKECFKDKNIINKDGSLNRKELAKIVYNNQEELEKLNKITFNHLVPQILGIINSSENVEFIIIDAPLLFESNLDKYCDYTITLKVSDELKIERMCMRDNISEEIAKKRLNIQNDNEFYITKSDFVIVNDENTSIEKLKEEIYKILNRIRNNEEEG